MRHFALAVGLILAASSVNAQQVPTMPGRYQIVMHPTRASATYLLDTVTGRVWELVTYTDLNGDPAVWRDMERIDDSSDIPRVVSRFGTKPQAPRRP